MADLQGPLHFLNTIIYLSGHLFVQKSPSNLWMCKLVSFLEERDMKVNLRLHQISFVQMAS